MSPQEYRSHAAACVEIAESVADTEHKSSLTAMAQLWLLLAHQAEKNLDTVVVYETPWRRGGLTP
jgi:hypothetical protein